MKNPKINFLRLDHLQICIPPDAEEQARAFYIDILGLNEIPKPEYLKANGGFWLEIAGIQLHIGVEEATGKSKRHPAFEVTQFREVKNHLEASGVRIKPDEPIPGFERFSIFDPFGNRIELLGRT